MGLTGCLLAALLANSPAPMEQRLEQKVSLSGCNQSYLHYEQPTLVQGYASPQEQFHFSNERQSRLVELFDEGFRWQGERYEIELNHGRLDVKEYNMNPFGLEEEGIPHEGKSPRGIYILFKKEF